MSNDSSFNTHLVPSGIDSKLNILIGNGPLVFKHGILWWACSSMYYILWEIRNQTPKAALLMHCGSKLV